MQQSKKLPAHSYYYHSSRSRGPLPDPIKPPKKSWRLKYFSVVLLITLVVISFFHFGKTSANDLSHTSKQMTKTQLTGNIPAMSSVINKVISGNSSIDFSVSITDLNSGQQENYGDNQQMTAGSVGKLITAVDFLHQVEIGQESLSEQLNGDSAQDELQQMIVVSDDTSWEDLNEELTYPQIGSYATSIGLNYDYVDNAISSQDINVLLQKLYSDQLLSSQDTKLLLSYMKEANYRSYIVPAVPSDDTIYHKIGLYNDNVNDAAIITHGSSAIALTIFTNGNGIYNWSERAQLIQEITKAVLACYFGQ
jgi:beta-lactamase class A